VKLTATDHDELERALSFKDWAVKADLYGDEDPPRIQAAWRSADGQPVGVVVMYLRGEVVHFASLHLIEPFQFQGLYTSLWEPDGLRGWLLERGITIAELGSIDPAMRAWWTRRGFRRANPTDPDDVTMRVSLESRPKG
jgi:hypothetical protein